MGRIILIIALCSFWTVISCLRPQLCIDKRYCDCDDPTSAILNCTCAKSVNDSSAPNVTRIGVSPITILKTWSYIGFQKCNILWLDHFAFSSYPPKVVEIIDIDALQMNTNVFYNITGRQNDESIIKKVQIENTRIFNLSAHFFHGVDAIDEIEFRNVTIGLIEAQAFTLVSNVKTLSIIDSKIDRIASSAFKNVSRIGTISIVNSIINTLDQDAISVQGMELFQVSKSVFNNLKNHSITLDQVKKVVIEESRLSSMESNCLNVGSGADLKFHKNYVKHLRNNALNGFGGAKSIVFVNNRIGIVEEQSIDILLLKDDNSDNSSQTIEVSKNLFPCTNGLCWMLYEDQSNWEKAALESNKCSGKNVSLAQFALQLHDICHQDKDDRGRSGGADIDQDQNNVLSHHGSVTTEPSLKSDSASIKVNYFIAIVSVITLAVLV